jgi:hypothetical protein
MYHSTGVPLAAMTTTPTQKDRLGLPRYHRIPG